MASALKESRGLDLASPRPVEAPPPSSPRTPGESRTGIEIGKRVKWHYVALLSVLVVLVTTSAVSFYAVTLAERTGTEVRDTLGSVERRLQYVDAGVRFDSKRRLLHLGIRDEILATNPYLSLDQAYEYASLLLFACDRYPSLDPVLLLAMGIVESGFDPQATSPVNARGLYQIWPSTGRMLARMFDWEYTDDMLYDPEKNTLMAALYLDVLFSAYNDERLVLAEYNGGPLNAGYLRAGAPRAANETREYVQKVRDVRARLDRKFDHGIDVQLLSMHRDPIRNGKRLGEPRRTASNRETN